MRGLAGDAGPSADLGPRVASNSEPIDRLLDRVVDVLGQTDQLG
jgi:hypothetical protein